MKYSIPIQVIVYSLLVFNVSAQKEHWDTYMAKFGDKPGSVLVDMGYKDAAPDSRYPFLVVTGPQAINCNKQGLPDKEEIDKLEEILDATNNFITGVTAKTLVGTLTYNCERLNYYYVKDTIGIRNAIMRLYKRNYANYNFAINMKADREWRTYLTFLYPNDTTLNWMDNDKIITKMLLDGDSLTKQRDINFALLFKTDKGRSAFAESAKGQGFKTDATRMPGNTNAGYELIVSKYGYVRMATINSISDTLKNELPKYDGYYVGWDAPLPPVLRK